MSLISKAICMSCQSSTAPSYEHGSISEAFGGGHVIDRTLKYWYLIISIIAMCFYIHMPLTRMAYGLLFMSMWFGGLSIFTAIEESTFILLRSIILSEETKRAISK